MTGFCNRATEGEKRCMHQGDGSKIGAIIGDWTPCTGHCVRQQNHSFCGFFCVRFGVELDNSTSAVLYEVGPVNVVAVNRAD